MSQNSPIEWTEATWNPVRGCVKVSPGCANCYAETFAERWRGVKGHAYEQGFDLRLVPEKLDEPLRRKKPTTYFVNSMSDLFQEGVPDAFIDRVFAVMALAPQHTFQILTKRADRMRSYVSGLGAIDWKARLGDTRSLSLAARTGSYPTWPLPNVWLGVSVENQHFADERIPLLLQTPAVVRFISAEPLLGPVALREYLGPRCDVCGLTATCFGVYEDPESEPRYACDRCCGHGNEDGWCRPVSEGGISDSPRGLDWVIVGGESGHGARPFDVAWARSIVAQCKAAGVPVFVKQLGADVRDRNDAGFEGDTPTSWPMDTDVEDHPNGFRDEYQGAPVRVRLAKKGGDPTEWPEDLRVREMPRTG